jgi:hypothetical protein
MSQKIKLQGNLSKLTQLKAVMEEAARVDAGGGGAPRPVPRSRWDPDGPACRQCRQPFGLITRRHHCR